MSDKRLGHSNHPNITQSLKGKHKKIHPLLVDSSLTRVINVYISQRFYHFELKTFPFKGFFFILRNSFDSWDIDAFNLLAGDL